MAGASHDATTTAATNHTPAAKATTKSSRPAKRVVLHLQPSVLRRFPSAQPPRKAPRSKPPLTSSDNQPGAPTDSASAQGYDDKDDTQSKSAPAEDNPQDPSDKAQSRKGVPGPKPGQKRSAPSNDASGTPKPRGKPGPKKRKGEGEPSTTTKPNGAGPSHHKLGPKANQGAINAGLRALDRTGKPCRRWNKRGFPLKSFTGVSWLMPTWISPTRKQEASEEVKSEKTASSEAKPENESSMVGSEKSNNGGDANATNATTATDLPSSPMPQSDAPARVSVPA